MNDETQGGGGGIDAIVAEAVGSGPGSSGDGGGDGAGGVADPVGSVVGASGGDSADATHADAPSETAGRDSDHWRRIVAQDRELRALRAKAKEDAAAREWRDSLMARAKSDPLAAARELGLSAEALIAAYAGMPADQADASAPAAKLPSDVEARLAKLDALEQRQAELERRLAAERHGSVQAEQDAIIGEIVSSGGDRYALTAEAGQAGRALVLEVAAELCELRRIEPTRENIRRLYEAALPAVEEHYEAQHKAQAERLRKSARLAGLYGLASAPAAPATHRGAPVAAAPRDARVPDSDAAWDRDATIAEAIRLSRASAK